jgi:hypothetical protein
MPQSTSNKFVFIHIPKNAGKYVEDRFDLSPCPGKEANQLGRSMLSNLARAFIRLDFKRQALSKNRLSGMIDIGLVAQHLTLVEMQLYGFIGLRLEDYHILATVRNPYTRMKSIYAHMTDKCERSQEHFESFVQTWPVEVSPNMRHNTLAFKRTQVDFLRDVKGRIPSHIVIARVERLECDLNDFEQQFDWLKVQTISTMQARSSALKEHQGQGDGLSARSDGIYISDTVKKWVYTHYREDFDFLGYSKE